MATKKKTIGKTYEDSQGNVFSSHAEAAASNSKMGTNPKDTSTYGKVGTLASATFFGGGASGRFDDLTEEQALARQKLDEEAGSLGVPMSEVGDYSYSKPGGSNGVPEYIIPMGQYKGMTASAAKELQAKQAGQLSPLNSFSFNLDSLNTLKNTAKQFQLSLDENMNNNFNSKGTKKTNTEALVAGASSKFADAFGSLEEFNSAYQNNPEVQKSLDSFIKAGGSLSDIQSKIQMKNNVPAGWDAQTYANFKQANPNLEPNAQDTRMMQSTPEYLNSLMGGDNSPESQAAEKAMFVEGELAKQEIARQYNMSNEVKRLYFGDDETIGILEQNKKIGEEKLKLIEKQMENAETNARDQADYEISKNNAEVAIAKSTIEQNRLSAKNYMTGMLAKLGALQTTGAAPLAIATLDQKYQQQKVELDTKLYYANQQIRVNLKKSVNDIQTKGEDAAIAIKEDLSKDQETAFKEIMKVQQDTQKEIYNITKGYVKDFKSEKAKYEAQAKANSDKYISSFMTLAGKGIDVKKIASMITADGRINTSLLTNANFAPKQKAYSSNKFDSKDTETFFNDLPSAFKSEWAVKFPSWEGTKKQTKAELKSDYSAWLKDNPGGKSDHAGDLSPANLTAGTNYILNNDGTDEDIQKFKTDREFQAWIMEQI